MGLYNAFKILGLEQDRNLLTDTAISVSGGFAIVQPGSQLSINAVEGFPLEDFSADVGAHRPLHALEYVNLLLL